MHILHRCSRFARCTIRYLMYRMTSGLLIECARVFFGAFVLRSSPVQCNQLLAHSFSFFVQQQEAAAGGDDGASDTEEEDA